MQTKKLLILILITALSGFFSFPGASPQAQAAEFNPSFIISDFDMRNTDTMTLDDVQKFLLRHGSALTAFVDPSIRVLASQLIYDNARLYKINPQVLLVMLQKEQSLIKDTNPSLNQLNWATGYGICDSCSKSDPGVQKYKGFANQIDYTASALDLYLDEPGRFGFQTGQGYTIDGQRVTISNDASRALYIYTPHIEGNRNFWSIWRDWFTQTYPDGSLLQDADSGTIFVIKGGQKRPFASKTVFISRHGNFDKVIPVSQTALEGYVEGRAIKYSEFTLLQSETTGGIFLLADDKKRPIISREVFRKLGFNPEEVEPVPDSELDLIPKGEPITLASAYPQGALLQDNGTGGVYFVQDGVKYPIWSREIMHANYPEMIRQPVAANFLDDFATGEPAKFKDGELIKTDDDPAVYFVSNGLKRPITSGQDFEKLGFSWDNIVVTNTKSLSIHLTGEPLQILENLAFPDVLTTATQP